MIRIKLILLISILFLTSCFGGSDTDKQSKAKKGYVVVKINSNDEKLFNQLKNGEIEVIYYFAYGCPHCNKFEPQISNWIKNNDNFNKVKFSKTPVSLLANWVDLSRLYYVAKQQGFLDLMHQPLFQALHKKSNPLNEWIEDIAKFSTNFATKINKNLTTEKIINLMEDEKISNQILADNEKVIILNLHTTPTILVRINKKNGIINYRIDNQTSAKFGGLIKVLNNLIQEQ